ncbi:putative RNA-directed DNA polymerase from transposon BS [Dictyocoela roeselum]|nr:putative RNA-directed DNA polymerase from transposon BS [Dictyocoela roeselum]
MRYWKEMCQLDAQHSHLMIYSLRRKHVQPCKPAGEAEIDSTVDSLKNTNSCGYDSATLQYLKDVLEVILSYLLLSVNTSIATNTFPRNFKRALIRAIHKQGVMNESLESQTHSPRFWKK